MSHEYGMKVSLLREIEVNAMRDRLACPCGCGFSVAGPQLIEVLEDLQRQVPLMEIAAGCRCRQRNTETGGVSGSTHTSGIAADVYSTKIGPSVIAEYLRETYPDKYGIGEYAGHVHIDVRLDKLRWEGPWIN